jgi:hypothetical protein
VDAPSGKRIHIKGTVTPWRSIWMIKLKVPFFTHTKIEPVVCDGVRAMVKHALSTQRSRELRFFLPIGLLAMSNWYQRNGMPLYMHAKLKFPK